jgi:TonB family protein
VWTLKQSIMGGPARKTLTRSCLLCSLSIESDSHYRLVCMGDSADIAGARDVSVLCDTCDLSSFEPHDQRTLWRGLSLSGVAHALIAVGLLVYGVELADLELRSTAPQRETRQPIKATFVFEDKQEPDLKPHLIPEKVAETTKPERELKAPKRTVRKVVSKQKRRTRRVTHTARRAPKASPTKPVPDAPAAIAPATEDTVATATAIAPHVAFASGPTTARPPSPSGGIASKFDRAGVLKDYVKSLSKAVRRRRAYPRAAKLAGLEGRAVVRIVLNEQGGIVTIELASSSGHAILDRAALEAARSVGTLPAAPSSLNWGTRAIKVPFSFKVAS